ncbi:MAG: NAD(P)H-binding protein [Lewinellaceae bacterium]|nr:NAD(P)H-binding protein [Lewinellaceae bacterium]
MPPLNKPIVVFGGTGHLGRKVVEKLLAKGVPVRVLTRNAASARDLLGPNVDFLEGDVCDPKMVEQAISETAGIVVALSAMSPKLIRREREIEYDAVLNILAEAKRQGVGRLVYLSVYGNRPDVLKQQGIGSLGAIQPEVERQIAESGLNWTILGNAPSYDLFFTFLRGKRLMVPGGGYRPIPCIHSEDVGEIAARAVLRDDLSGRRFHMTGPRAISFPEFAEMVSGITGRPVRHQAIPLAILNVLTALIKPFNPFFRSIYFAVKLFNHFPADLAEAAPAEHRRLEETFGYAPVGMEEVIGIRFSEGVTKSPLH